jgi:hypothetical protein
MRIFSLQSSSDENIGSSEGGELMLKILDQEGGGREGKERSETFL